VKTRAAETDEAPSGMAPLGPLSPALAFVVQFRERALAAAGNFTGRVEHIASGDAARFESPEDLLAFLGRVLRAAQTDLLDDAQTGSVEVPRKWEEKS
jgi:hypothetical protein